MDITKLLLSSALCVCSLAQTSPQTAVLACNMKAISAAERLRYNALVQKLKTAVKQQRELADGYAWQLDGRTIPMPEAAEWVTMERRCCPFLTLQLEATGSDTLYWINLKGPAGVKAFLQAEFKIDR